MTQAIPRDRVEAGIAKAVNGLAAMVARLPITPDVPRDWHALIAHVQGDVLAEGLTAKHWPQLAEIVRTYQRRCREAGLEPWEFTT